MSATPTNAATPFGNAMNAIEPNANSLIDWGTRVVCSVGR